jgi:hypothetical protein
MEENKQKEGNNGGFKEKNKKSEVKKEVKGTNVK